jgi:hypothetical protein
MGAHTTTHDTTGLGLLGGGGGRDDCFDGDGGGKQSLAAELL